MSKFSCQADEIKAVYLTTPLLAYENVPKWAEETFEVLKGLFPRIEKFDLAEAYKRELDFDKFWGETKFVFVSGGNSFVLSYWMKKTGSREILRKLIMEDKIVYGGESAGCIYAYKSLKNYAILDEPEKAPEVVYEGLDLVDFAPIPHWGVEKYMGGLREIDGCFRAEGVKSVRVKDDGVLVVGE